MEEEIKKSWFKENWGILTILLVALIIRIYYFILTKNSVLWYDEAVYMNMAHRFAFHTEYIFGPVRQVFFPFIISLFYHISVTEFLPRLFLLVCSVFSVLGIYLLGKEIVNKNVGLISASFMAVFYLNLFFTSRLLVDLPSLTFFIFSAYFFYRYINTKKSSNLYWFALMIGIGALFKLSTAFILIVCLIFFIVTEGFKFLKRKEIWISALIFCLTLLPYIIFGYKEFGGFVLTQASAHVAPESYLNGFNLLWNYITSFPGYFGFFIGCIFIGFIYSLYRPILYHNKLKEDNSLKGTFYLLLLFIIPLILISFMVNHNEDRYIITCFTSIIILGSVVADMIYQLIKKKYQLLGVIFIILLIGFFAFQQLKLTDSLINNKVDSYLQVKEAGIWLKDNVELYGEGIVATKSQPQIKYYSGLDTLNLPPTEEEFKNWTSQYNPRYFILSVFETHPEWSYTYPERNNLTPIQAYFTSDNQPILVIYQIR